MLMTQLRQLLGYAGAMTAKPNSVYNGHDYGASYMVSQGMRMIDPSSSKEINHKYFKSFTRRKLWNSLS
jgi:hypothetical protein